VVGHADLGRVGDRGSGPGRVAVRHVGTGTLTFARIKLLYIGAASGNTNDVQITRPASNGVPLFLAAGDGIAVRPDGKFVWVAPGATGIAVTAGTGDLITLTNSGGTTGVTYDVVIIGASA
jgi:DNA-binding beta-propeller fold protein YncE